MKMVDVFTVALLSAVILLSGCGKSTEDAPSKFAAAATSEGGAFLDQFKAYDANMDTVDPSAMGEARDLLEKASHGDVQGMLGIGNCYAHGRNVKLDLARAEYWYRRAWAGKNAWALYELALLYLDHPESHSVTLAVRLLETLSGNVDFGYPGKYALWDLGRCHRDGVGTPKDEEKAVACWWRLLSVLPSGRETMTSRTLQRYRTDAKSALDGMGRLPPILGCIGGELDDAAFLAQFKRVYGKVSPYDTAATGKVKEILEKLRSKSLKSPHDLCVLGFEYLEGWRVARDPIRAEYWFRRAWMDGDAWGVFGLAEAYLDGTLGVRSPETAFRIFRVLSESPRYGYVQRYALCELGRCYQGGIGTHRDPEKARRAYERALDGYAVSPRSQTARAYRAAAEHGLKTLGKRSVGETSRDSAASGDRGKTRE